MYVELNYGCFFWVLVGDVIVIMFWFYEFYCEIWIWDEVNLGMKWKEEEGNMVVFLVFLSLLEWNIDNKVAFIILCLEVNVNKN